MSRFVVFVLLCLLLPKGCKKECKTKQIEAPLWRVQLIRPDGVVHKTYLMRSRLEPKCYPHRGGQVELYYDNGGGVSGLRSAKRFAPTGWIWDCSMVKKNTHGTQ